MDPFTAFLLSTAFAFAAKKGHEGVALAASDWQAFRNGDELPTAKRKRILAELHASLAEQNKEFQSMSANQRARYLNQIGKTPGIGTLVGTQYKNAAAAANRKLSAYWDEKERRALDPEYARQVDEAKARAKQQARDKWTTRKNKIKEQGRWVATGTSKFASGKDAFKDWLREQIPEEQPEPPKDPPPRERENEDPEPPGPDPGSGPGTGEPFTPSGGGFNPDYEPPGSGPSDRDEPPWMQDYTQAWDQRADEEWDRRNRNGDWTASDVTPEPEGLTTGPPKLGPAPEPPHTPEEGHTDMAKDNAPATRDNQGSGLTPRESGSGLAPRRESAAPGRAGAGNNPTSRSTGTGTGAVYAALAKIRDAEEDLRSARSKINVAALEFEGMGATGVALESVNRIHFGLSSMENNINQVGTHLANKAIEIADVAERHDDMPSNLRDYRN